MAKKRDRGYAAMFGPQTEQTVETQVLPQAEQDLAVPAPSNQETDQAILASGQTSAHNSKKRGRPVGSLGKQMRKDALSLKMDHALHEKMRLVSDQTGVPFGRVMEDAARFLLLSSSWKSLLEDDSIETASGRESKLEEDRKVVIRRYLKPENE